MKKLTKKMALNPIQLRELNSYCNGHNVDEAEPSHLDSA